MKAKKVLILLAVIGANVLHNMPVHTAFADNVYWYGKTGNTWTDDVGSAAATGVTITLTKDSTDGTHSATTYPTYFYAGYSKTANVSGNTLTLSGGSFNTSAQTTDTAATKFYGGYYNGDTVEHSVSGNTVKVTVSSMSATKGYFQIIGGENDLGTVSGNIVNLDGVSVSNKIEVYGGRIGNDATAVSDNQVNISNSTFNGEVNFSGGYSLASVAGTVSGDSVTVTNSTFNAGAVIYGSTYATDDVEVAVSGGKVTIDGATFNNETNIYGSMSGNGNASGGTVVIKDSSFVGETEIYGNYSGNANATDGNMVLDGVTFSDGVVYVFAGGGHYSSNNTLTVDNISFSNVGFVGLHSGVGGSGNNLIINSVDFTGVSDCFIGLSGTGDDNNTVTINGGKFNAADCRIIAGDGTGNILNINTCIDGKIDYIAYFQNINFKAPSGMDTALTMLTYTNVVDANGLPLQDFIINFDLNGLSLADDDFVTLIDNVDGTDYTPADAHYQVLDYSDAAGEHSILVYSGGTNPIKPDYKVTDGTTTKTGNFRKTYNTVVNGTDYTGKITGNEMDIDGGKYESEVYGAGAIKDTGTHTVSNNTANIEGGNFISKRVRESFDIWTDTVKIAGGYGNSSGSASIAVSNNELNISGGKFTRDLYDFYLAGGILDNEVADATLNASGNTLNVSGGSFNIMDTGGEYIYFAGTYVYSNCKAETVTIADNTVVFGAEDTKISVTENFRASIYGARFGENSSDVTSKDVTISSNKVSVISDTDKASVINVCGGFTWNCEHFIAANNVVNIGKEDGSTVFENMKFYDIYGANVVWGGGW